MLLPDAKKLRAGSQKKYCAVGTNLDCRNVKPSLFLAVRAGRDPTEDL